MGLGRDGVTGAGEAALGGTILGFATGFLITGFFKMGFFTAGLGTEGGTGGFGLGLARETKCTRAFICSGSGGTGCTKSRLKKGTNQAQ